MSDAALLQANLLSDFVCLGDKCSDTCCKNWSMQMDERTYDLYTQQAPELLDAVECATESDRIMRKASDGFCVKFQNGLCGIHQSYGDRFLGDACHFYPRATRLLGEHAVMTATMSCPEIARRMLEMPEPSALHATSLERMPYQMQNYKPDALSSDDALALHRLFLDAARDVHTTPEQAFQRIVVVSRFLQNITHDQWLPAAQTYFKVADGMMVPPQPNPTDPFNLLHALCGLTAATHKPVSERLQRTIRTMEDALNVTLHWEDVTIETHEGSLDAYARLQKAWHEEGGAAYITPILRRWLEMQLSVMLYPFAGLGHNVQERVTLLGMRMAIVKLALISTYAMSGHTIPQDDVVRVVQSIARILDHLADPAFSLRICEETGWGQEPRMRALLEL